MAKTMMSKKRKNPQINHIIDTKHIKNKERREKNPN